MKWKGNLDLGDLYVALGFGKLSEQSSAPTQEADTLILYGKTDHKLYYRQPDGTEVEVGSGSGGASIDEGASFPTTGSDPILFFRTDLDALFLYSPTASTWIDISGLIGGDSASVDEGSAFPSTPGEVTLFYRTDLDAMFIYSPTESAWLDISGLVSVDTSNWSSKSANFTAEKNIKYLVDTSSGVVSVTLPSSPSAGDTFYIMDSAANFATNNCKLLYGSSKILSTSNNYLLDDDNGFTQVTYVDTTVGWIVTTQLPTGSFE